MKTILAVLAFAGASLAHNQMTHFHINGVANPDCVRQAQSTNPLIDLSSENMACNIVKGNAKSKCTIKPDDVIAFEWRADPNIPAADYPLKDGTIPVGVTDDSHKGPCAVYMKKVSDSSSAVGAGDGWFKVSEDGLQNGVFCTDRLRLANLPQPGVLPGDIEAGDYLIRAEMLTLNNAGPVSNPPTYDENGVQAGGQPQFYVGCVQVTVEGTSGTASPSTVSIPGYVDINSPGLLFDIWNTPSNIFSNYPMPGPSPLLPDGTAGTIAGSPDTVPSAVPSASNAPTSTAAAPPSKTSTKAPKPTTTVADSAPTTSANFVPISTIDDSAPPASTPDAATTTTAPAATHSNIKYVTATTLITRTSTLHYRPSGSPGGAADSESTSVGDDAPHSTHAHHGYHGARGYGSHRRRAL